VAENLATKSTAEQGGEIGILIVTVCPFPSSHGGRKVVRLMVETAGYVLTLVASDYRRRMRWRRDPLERQ
jgi:hypothetical protein